MHELHETRSYIWWPKMDRDIEITVKSCEVCQSIQATPPVALLHPWEWPDEPWSHLHLDFARPFLGKMYLVMHRCAVKVVGCTHYVRH